MKIDNIKINPQWSRSKEEIWNERFSGLEEVSPGRTPFFHLSRPAFYYSLAAFIFVAVLFSSMAFLNTRVEVVPKGMHRMITLPDGSRVTLNADTKLTYKPAWWYVSRSVTLQGEAFFEVKPGKKFDVHSASAMVRVLGTSFNVFDRSGMYRATCITGKVQVNSNGQTAILEPGMQASVSKGSMATNNLADASQIICWTEHEFVFLSTPLNQVIEEIERQYNIDILVPENMDYSYTGNFSKLEDPEQVLEIVGKPFGIKLKIK